MEFTAETKVAFIRIDEEGILRLKIKDKAVCKEKEVKELFDIYRKWGCDKHKVLQLIEMKWFFIYEIDAQKYAAKHGKDFFIASALVSRVIAVRIIFNFFNRIFNRYVPFKIFSNEKNALKWLRTFK